jgi:adenylosuccinate synthase
MTRHGAGPLVSFSREMTDQIEETHNIGGSEWLGEFRNGHYDPVAMRYAIEISGGKESYDGLMISYLDVLAKFKEWPVVEAYVYEGEKADDLEQYFDLDGDKILGIKVHPDNGGQDHLDHQMRLTELLKKCRPVLTTLKPSENKSLEQVFLDYVEENLGIPVVSVSRGPRVEDREVRFGWEHLFT